MCKLRSFGAQILHQPQQPSQCWSEGLRNTKSWQLYSSSVYVPLLVFQHPSDEWAPNNFWLSLFPSQRCLTSRKPAQKHWRSPNITRFDLTYCSSHTYLPGHLSPASPKTEIKETPAFALAPALLITVFVFSIIYHKYYSSDDVNSPTQPTWGSGSWAKSFLGFTVRTAGTYLGWYRTHAARTCTIHNTVGLTLSKVSC